MITKADEQAYQSKINFLERQVRVLEETLLDHFAQASVASGRCSPAESYTWAKMAMEERKKHVGS